MIIPSQSASVLAEDSEMTMQYVERNKKPKTE